MGHLPSLPERVQTDVLAPTSNQKSRLSIFCGSVGVFPILSDECDSY